MRKPTTKAKEREHDAVKRDRDILSAKYWARLDAMTEEEVLAAARSDPDALPAEDYPPGRLGPPRRVAYAKHLRWKLGLSQSAFARAFRIPLGTLRDWEQHRREPDQAARAYLEVIAREPEAVRRALKQAKRDTSRQARIPREGAPLPAR